MKNKTIIICGFAALALAACSRSRGDMNDPVGTCAVTRASAGQTETAQQDVSLPQATQTVEQTSYIYTQTELIRMENYSFGGELIYSSIFEYMPDGEGGVRLKRMYNYGDPILSKVLPKRRDQSFEYDDAEGLVTEYNNSSMTSQTYYDEEGREIESIVYRSNGSVGTTTYTSYDELGQKVKTVSYTGTEDNYTAVNTTEYTYTNGYLEASTTSSISRDGFTVYDSSDTYEYDDLGRNTLITSEYKYANGIEKTDTTETEYDDYGNVIHTVYTDGFQGSVTETVYDITYYSQLYTIEKYEIGQQDTERKLVSISYYDYEDTLNAVEWYDYDDEAGEFTLTEIVKYVYDIPKL